MTYRWSSRARAVARTLWRCRLLVGSYTRYLNVSKSIKVGPITLKDAINAVGTSVNARRRRSRDKMSGRSGNLRATRWRLG